MQSDPPYRQVRALFDDKTITVYQAYSSAIAVPAVKEQKLSASSSFSYGRMTWIKPSWCWMMYRSGYSYKDPGQAHILAIKLKREHFLSLLERAVLTTHGTSSTQKSADTKDKPEVKVQWDPERAPNLEKLPHRSIQIGIPRALSQQWVEEWIVSIENVTEKAQNLKAALDENPDLSVEELIKMNLHPIERVFQLPEHIATALSASED
jgi:hypothetical protein